MFIQIILDHIPRSWKAAVALVVLIGALGMGFNALALALVEPSPVVWFKVIAGLLTGTGAAVFFYIEQKKAERGLSMDQVRVETLARQSEDERIRKAAASIQAYHLNDPPAGYTDKTPDSDK